jgi:hypothetical protein
MSTLQKLNNFAGDMGKGIFILNTDTITVALTDVAPTAASHVLADITQISYTNLSSRNLTSVTWTNSATTVWNLIAANLTLTSSVGSVAQFRYIVFYDNTSASDNLLGWVDYGSEINLNGANGDTLLLSFDATNGLVSVS